MDDLSAKYKGSIAAQITAAFQAVPTRYVVAVIRAVRKRELTPADSDNSVEAVIAHVIACLGCGFPTPLYIMTGGTYISRDGEYRHRLIWYETFLEAEFPTPLDEYVTDLINENELAFHTSLFGGASLDDDERSRILNRLEEDRIALRAFQACWMVDTVTFLKSGLTPNHHHLAYAKLMYRETEQEDKVVLDEIMKEKTYEEIVVFNSKWIITEKHGRLEIGCKYIPLTVGDLEDMVDPRVPVWREYKLTQKLADLAVSGVCSGFPIIRGFFYVQNVHEGFFDNPEIQQDFIVQDHLQASVEKIKEAQKVLRQSQQEDPTNRLQSFEEGLEQPLERADRYLRLSGLALATVMEHVGSTARDLPRMVYRMILDQRAGAFRPYINTAMFSTTAFLKVFFDWMWGFLCMHAEGVMHADPHLNNITFQRVSKTFQRDTSPPTADTYQYYQILELRDVDGTNRIVATTPPIDFPFTKYTLRSPTEDEPALEYLFPYYDIAGGIIDMSRALLRDIPADNAEVAESILDGQIKWVMYLLELFGESEDCLDLVTKNRARLVYLMQTEWPDMFRVLSVLDAWTLSFYWGGLLTEKVLKEQGITLEVHPSIREMLVRVHKISVEWLRMMLQTLVRAETLHVRDALANHPATMGSPFERSWANQNSNQKSNQKPGWYFPLQWIIERAFRSHESGQFQSTFDELATSTPLGERPEGDARWRSSPLRREFDRKHPGGVNALVFDTQVFEAPRYSATDPARYAPETKKMLKIMRDWNSAKANKRIDTLDEARAKDLPREAAFVDKVVGKVKGGGELLEWPLEGF